MREVNVEDILFNGKPVGKEHSEDMLELLKDIEKQATIEGIGNYTFNRSIVGWKHERTMRLGTELHKLLLKMQADGLHINIDIPVEGEKGKYTSFYRGPDLEIDEKGQKVEVTG
jgi:hypothetical protein